MIHLTDSQSDNILAVITQKNVLSNKHKQSLKDYLETFDFIVLGDKAFVEHLAKRNRIIIPAEDQGFKEFIIHNLIKEKGDKHRAEVFAVGSYLELKKAKIIEPTTLTEYTATMHVSFATNNTEWSPGIVESDNFRTLTISTATNPFAYLKRIANEFDLELNFRVETDGNKVTGRYVDLLERTGQWRGREVTFGKDLQSIRRKEDFSNIFTALKGLSPEDEEGNRQEVVVEDEDALQRWGRPDPVTGELKHLIEPYEPQSDRQDMTLEQLEQYTRTELNKRINSVVEYEADIVDLENVPGMENKKIRFGDTLRIKDEKFNPALYLEARVHTQERNIFTKANKKVELGDYIEYTEEEVNAVWQQLQKAIQSKLSMSDLMDVTYTKDIIDQKDVPGNDAKEKLDRDVGESVIETTTGAQDKADQAESESNNYTDLKEQAIRQDLADKAGLEYVDGQLALKADGDIVQTIDNTVNNLQGVTDGLLSDVADHATELQTQGGKITTVETDLDTVEGELEVALTDLSTLDGVVESQGTQISANTSAISLKAEQTTVEGLQDEFDALSIGGRNYFPLSNFELYSGHMTFDSVEGNSIYATVVGYNNFGLTVKANDYTVEDGENYVVSGYLFVNGSPVKKEDIDTFNTRSDFINKVETINESTGFFMFSFKVDGGFSWFLHARINTETILEGDQLEIRELKLEKGNKATDWTPAPEDIESDINAVDTKVTDLNAEVEVVAGQVELKAERSELETVEGDVSTLSNEIGNLTVAYDGIEASVSSLESTTDGLTSDVSSLNTNIQAVAGEVSSKVDATYVEGVVAKKSNTYKVVARSYSKRNEPNFPPTGFIDEDGNDLSGINGSSSNDRSYTLIIFERDNSQFVSSERFDVYSDSSEAGRLADELNNLDRTKLIILLGAHAPGKNRLTNGLPDAIYRCGGSENIFKDGDWSDHPAYVLVGIPTMGEGEGLELFSPVDEAGIVESLITINNGTIDFGRYDQTTVSKLSTAESEITQLAGRVDTKAEVSVVDGLETRTTTAEQSIDALEGQISQKIDDGEARSIFLQEANSFTFDADQVNFTGHVFGQDATFLGRLESNEIISPTIMSEDDSQEYVWFDDTADYYGRGSVGARQLIDNGFREFFIAGGGIYSRYEEGFFSNGMKTYGDASGIHWDWIDGAGNAVPNHGITFEQNGDVYINAERDLYLTRNNGQQIILETIVEQGSNSNGSWIRYSSGKQEVWCAPVIASATNASGSIYRSDAFDVNYPVDFDTNYDIAVSANVSSIGRWANANNPFGASSCSIIQYSTVSSSSQYSVYVYAVGRWR